MEVDRIARLEGVADNEDVLQLDRLHTICTHTRQNMAKGEGRARGKGGSLGYVEDNGLEISHGVVGVLLGQAMGLSKSFHEHPLAWSSSQLNPGPAPLWHLDRPLSEGKSCSPACAAP
ncbi:hypothetical protein GCM10023063_26630 [Arthrobacter methylotrophus]